MYTKDKIDITYADKGYAGAPNREFLALNKIRVKQPPYEATGSSKVPNPDKSLGLIRLDSATGSKKFHQKSYNRNISLSCKALNTENYACLRKNDSIPIIDYNRRNEKITSEALRKRGYDQNRSPFAPCGIPTKPNGFDMKHHRHTFCCFKQCLDLKVAGIKNIQKNYNIGFCSYVKNRNVFYKHIYLKDNPRLINEIPRGTKRFKIIQRYRSAAERTNSTIKENLKIIDKPIVYNKGRADILAQVALENSVFPGCIKHPLFIFENSVIGLDDNYPDT